MANDTAVTWNSGMSGQWIDYFGYGSLVNRETRPIDEIGVDARLHGWRRSWSHRSMGGASNEHNCTSLTVEPVSDSNNADLPVIDGVLVRLKSDALAELDQREYGYERLTLDADCFDLPPDHDCQEIVLYRSLPANRHTAEPHFPILQSYVDCVLAGYLRRFGNEGLQRMLNTTVGWDRYIMDDRLEPLYPRHVIIQADQQAGFDNLIRSQRRSSN